LVRIVITGIGLALAAWVVAGCGHEEPPPPAEPAQPVVEDEPAPLTYMLGDTHRPLLELHGIEASSPDQAVSELAVATSASDLLPVNHSALRAQLSKVAAQPDIAMELLTLGEVCVEERRYGLSTFWLDRAAALDPLYPRIFVQMGDALREFDRPSLAIEAYDRAASLDPEAGMVWVKLGRLCMEEGRRREAREDGPSLRQILQNAQERAPDEADRLWAETALARLDLAEGLYEGAPWDEEGSDGEPVGVGPLRVRTTAALERGLLARDVDVRIAHFRQAAQLDPRSAVPAYNLALALKDAQLYAEAVAEFERAREIAAESGEISVPEAMAGEAACLVAMGQIAEAEALASAAAGADPELAYAHYVHALTAWEAGDVEATMERCRAALAVWPEHAESLDLIGDCLLAQALPAEAGRAYRYALWAEGDSDRRAEILAEIESVSSGAEPPSDDTGSDEPGAADPPSEP
jgi:tetratricopeptide (TPR) repeat protein